MPVPFNRTASGLITTEIGVSRDAVFKTYSPTRLPDRTWTTESMRVFVPSRLGVILERLFTILEVPINTPRVVRADVGVGTGAQEGKFWVRIQPDASVLTDAQISQKLQTAVRELSPVLLDSGRFLLPYERDTGTGTGTGTGTRTGTGTGTRTRTDNDSGGSSGGGKSPDDSNTGSSMGLAIVGAAVLFGVYALRSR